MSTVRGVKDRRFKFVQILNSMFEDKNLSLKAKGFIGYCLTKTEDWVFHIDHLIANIKEGRDAIYSIINECIENGYAYRSQLRDEKGRASTCEFIISDSKEEIATIRREIESQPNFKKFLPLPEKSDTVKADPKKSEPVFPGENRGAIYSNTDNSNIREQQQQGPPVLPVADVAFSNTENKQAAKPLIYESLRPIEIPDPDKIEITSRYSEEVVKKAVEFALETKDKVKTTFVAYLKMACAKGLKVRNRIGEEKSPNEAAPDQTEQNKAMVEEFRKTHWETVGKRIHPAHPEWVRIGDYDKLYYKDPKFNELFKHFVMKLR